MVPPLLGVKGFLGGGTPAKSLTYGTFGLLQGPLVQDVTKHRQEEGDGLPAACLGNADQVPARHDGGDGLGLNRCRFFVIVPVRREAAVTPWVGGRDTRRVARPCTTKLQILIKLKGKPCATKQVLLVKRIRQQ